MISSHQEEKKNQKTKYAVKIFFPFPYPSFSLWNKAKLSADLSRKRVLSKVFHWPDSHSLIWTIAASGKKSSVRDVFWPWQSWLEDCSVSFPWLPCLGLPGTCQLQEKLMLLQVGGLTMARSSKHLWGFSLPQALSPFGIVLVSGRWSRIRHDLETCRHIFHVFGIQTLGSKLSSEHWLNHPSFSVNTTTQLPAQLLSYDHPNVKGLWW